MNEQYSVYKEIRTHGTQSFPCAAYRTHSSGRGTLVKHHWHEEAEVLYFSGGKFRLEINMESFPAHAECFYFINPGELHGIITETANSHCSFRAASRPGILHLPRLKVPSWTSCARSVKWLTRLPTARWSRTI